jgi:hypothetical protein
MRLLSNPRAASRPRLLLPVLIALLGLGAATGCVMQPSFAAKTTTADGVVVEVPMTPEPQVITDDVVTISKLVLMPLALDKEGKTKGIGIAIQVSFVKGARPVSVMVDDVSDEPILNLVSDANPKLTGENHWNMLTAPHSPMDEYAKWVMSLDNTIRVYRFTIKLADGTTHVLRYPIFVPQRAKAMIRYQLGVTL